MASLIDCRRNDQLARALIIVGDLPPLSPMVRHLLATLYSSSDETSLSQVALWIEKDTLTSGRTLALANSAYYARREPILSIRQAVSRLGMNAIRNLVVSMSMSRYWNRIPTPADWSTSRFNAHSIGTAVLSERIASVLSPANTEVAFLAGLFHDIGHVIIAILLRDNMDGRKRLSSAEHAGLQDLELELVGFTHPELSARIVRSWNLPASIEEAVRHHETIIESSRPNSLDEVPLCQIVQAADCCVDCEGLSIDGLPKRDKSRVLVLNQLGAGLKDSTIFHQFRSELDTLLNVL